MPARDEGNGYMILSSLFAAPHTITHDWGHRHSSGALYNRGMRSACRASAPIVRRESGPKRVSSGFAN
jgi:hypothetical protein